MFSCQSCLTSALRAVVHDVSPTPSHLVRRKHAARAVHTTRHRASREIAAIKQPSHKHASRGVELDKSGESKPVLTGFKPKHLKKELTWLGDPLKFNTNTKQLLAKGREEKALELIRLAGKNNSVVVSWNHLLQYNMQKGRVSPALKLFNEMKKRSQKPDAYTYSILLKGLADNSRNPLALDKALLLYQSMTAANSQVRPSMIHTNTVLQICGLTKDIGKMFEVASGLPKSGKGAPDHITFSTILHSIRVAVMDQHLRYGKQDRAVALQRCKEAIHNGKRIWADVIERWTEGTLMIDERLVCAIARLLMLSSSVDRKEFNPGDIDDIPSLFEQAMGVPRQFPKLPLTRKGDAALPAQEADEIGEVVLSEESNQTTMQQLDRGAYDADDDPDDQLLQFTRTDETSVFDPVPMRDGQVRAYAKPGNNALSIIITACAYLRQYDAAAAYWDKLERVVQPDQENCHSLLRVFRVSRKFRHALVIVKKMRQPRSTGGYEVGVEAKTFRIAMSACGRDNKNPNVIDTALQLIRIMNESLEVPDYETIVGFCRLLKARGRETDVRLAVGSLEVLHSLIKNAKGEYYYGGGMKRSNAISRNDAERRSKDAAVTPTSMEASEKDQPRNVDIYELASSVESITARALDHYREELGQATRIHWIQNLEKLRKWIRKLEQEGRGGRTSRRGKGDKESGQENEKKQINKEQAKYGREEESEN